LNFEKRILEARIAKLVESKENQVELIHIIYEDKINKIKKVTNCLRALSRPSRSTLA
jgi:hypothetical protein